MLLTSAARKLKKPRTVGEGQQIADALAADAEQEKAIDNAIDITPPDGIDVETGEIKE